MNAVVTVHGDLAIVLPARGQDRGEIARALLDAAPSPRRVRTVTTADGMGWQVPLPVAEKAGLVARPKKARRRKRAASDGPGTSDSADQVTARP